MRELRPAVVPDRPLVGWYRADRCRYSIRLSRDKTPAGILGGVIQALAARSLSLGV